MVHLENNLLWMEQRCINLALESVVCLTIHFKWDFRGPGFGNKPQLFWKAVIPEVIKQDAFWEACWAPYVSDSLAVHSFYGVETLQAQPPLFFKGILLPAGFGRVWYSCKKCCKSFSESYVGQLDWKWSQDATQQIGLRLDAGFGTACLCPSHSQTWLCLQRSGGQFLILNQSCSEEKRSLDIKERI